MNVVKFKLLLSFVSRIFFSTRGLLWARMLAFFLCSQRLNKFGYIKKISLDESENSFNMYERVVIWLQMQKFILRSWNVTNTCVYVCAEFADLSSPLISHSISKYNTTPTPHDTFQQQCTIITEMDWRALLSSPYININWSSTRQRVHKQNWTLFLCYA